MRASGYFCLSLVALAACGAPGKEDPTDDFSELAGVDDKSDKFTGKFTVGNSAAAYGSSTTINVSASKVYGAIVFYGNGGDVVEVRASAKNKDSVLWLLNDKYEILKFNDDSGGSLDSYVKYTLPVGSGERKYYAVARDYYKRAASITLKLDGKQDFFACEQDLDCLKIQKGCCAYQGQIAVAADRRQNYLDARGVCTMFCIALAPPPDFTVPACNKTTKSCELVAPAFCGGIAPGAFPCKEGTQCQDDPRDSCDPQSGGADCGGICQQCPARLGCDVGESVSADGCNCEPVKDGCESNADCGAGSKCEFCWFSKQCIPDGAVC